MSFLRSKKGIALLTATIVAVVAAVLGYAYFTASGSGTGTATVGSASNLALSSDAVSGLLPGGPPTPVTVHIHNPSSGNEYVDGITGAVRGDGGCLGSWFEVSPVSYRARVDAGASASTSSSIRMLETGTSQDDCQGKTLTIDWSSGNGVPVPDEPPHLSAVNFVQAHGFDASVGGWIYEFAVSLTGPAAADTTIGLLAVVNGVPNSQVVAAQQNVTIATGQTSANFLVVAYDRAAADGALIYAILGAENVNATLHSV
jgi:hypothetical protein